MNLIKELPNKTVSIPEFNRGLTGRIFDDVKVNGSKIVLKNNTPEYIPVSPDEYMKLTDELEDTRDLMFVNTRMLSMDKSDLVSQGEFEGAFRINLNKAPPLDEDEIE